jgi:DNA-binding transcriptional MocR family regulator
MEWQTLTHEKPKFQQIIDQVVTAIEAGNLQAGDKLPPERQLASRLNVNRSTVVRALEELVSLGWVVRKQGSGTQISDSRWGRLTEPRVNWRHSLKGTLQEDSYLSHLRELQKDKRYLDLATGELPVNLVPDFDLPNLTWENILEEEKQVDATGYRPLKEAICRHLFFEQQLEVAQKDLLITSGAQQGVFLLLQVLLEAGDSIAIEDPSFLYALPIFAAAGIRLYGVPMDHDGLKIAELEQLILQHKIKLIMVNPSFQNPTGKVMSYNRRKALIALSLRYQIPIVEDDVFGDLAFSRREPTLKSLAPEQVIYLGSLSKVFGSSIRVGWLVAHPTLIASLEDARHQMDFSMSVFPQVLAYSALSAPRFNLQREQLVAALKKRAAAFLAHLASVSADWLIEPVQGGLYVWLTWRHHVLHRRDWQLFLNEKILISPSFIFSDDNQSFRINYTRLEESQMDSFIQSLQKITLELKNSQKTLPH